MAATKVREHDAQPSAEDRIAEAQDNVRKAEIELNKAIRDADLPAGPSIYDAQRSALAEAGIDARPFDQRAQREIVDGTGPSREHRRAELEAQKRLEDARIDDFIETVRSAIDAGIPGRPGAVDQRKANDHLRMALERMAAGQTAGPSRAELAASALRRLDQREGILKRGSGLW
jgi:hypothetical protein